MKGHVLIFNHTGSCYQNQGSLASNLYLLTDFNGIAFHKYFSVAFDETRPLQNPTFGPISVSYSNFNPRNTRCIPVVKIFVFLELEQKSAFFKGLETGAAATFILGWAKSQETKKKP
jgi:hypothetical protein